MSASQVTLAHGLKDRVRVKVPVIRRDAEKAYILEILLRKREGVRRVEANPRTSGVVVFFDPDELRSDELMQFMRAVVANLPNGRRPAGRKTGAKRERPSTGPAREMMFALEGMTCQSCALLAELILGRMDGIESAAVSYASGSARVTGSASREDVFKEVAGIGYEPRPMDTLSQRMMLVENERKRLREAKRRLVASAVLTAPVMVAGMSMSRVFLPRLISFLLTTPIVFSAGRPFFSKAFLMASRGTANMDTLIAIGSGAAYFHSAWSFFTGRKHLYFESAAGIITLILLGRYLEEKARGKASEAVRKLVELQPLTATVIRDGEERRVGIDEVLVGDKLVLRPGQRVPVDGEIVSGVTTVDESLVTGESIPVGKGEGDTVTGGTINLGGMVQFRATAVGGDTVLAGIIRMVEQAQSSRVPVQRLADRVSAVFVPAVIALAGLVFAGRLMAGYRLSSAMMRSVSVLLISCPCSLGLATPTAVMAGTGTAAREGIYIRDAEALETAGRIDVLVLDKTGTLTEGRPFVTDFLNRSRHDDRELLRLVASAELGSEHYAGKAIVEYAASQGVDRGEAVGFEAMFGRGVRAVVEGSEVIVGNEALLEEQGIDPGDLRSEAERLGREGKTPVFIGVGGAAAGMIAVADRPRDTAAAAVRRLASMGIGTMMVTGDNPQTGRYVAGLVGIGEVVAGATPAQKVEIIRSLREHGNTVGMIGDGVNDAPALAEADVGFAIGLGTDIAMEASHVTLVGGDIFKAAEAIALSRKTMRIIRENLFWAFAYNTLAIPLAAFGSLTPTIASGAMAVSSVSVVANSLRLQRGVR